MFEVPTLSELRGSLRSSPVAPNNQNLGQSMGLGGGFITPFLDQEIGILGSGPAAVQPMPNSDPNNGNIGMWWVQTNVVNANVELFQCTSHGWVKVGSGISGPDTISKNPQTGKNGDVFWGTDSNYIYVFVSSIEKWVALNNSVPANFQKNRIPKVTNINYKNYICCTIFNLYIRDQIDSSGLEISGKNIFYNANYATYFSQNDILKIRNNPNLDVINSIILSNIKYISDAMPSLGVISAEAWTLIALTLLVKELRPYGSEAIESVWEAIQPDNINQLELLINQHPKPGRPASLECRGYSELTALIFNLLHPTSNIRLYEIGWRSSGVGAHNQLWAEGCAEMGFGMPNLLLDPNFGVVGYIGTVNSPGTFNDLRLGNPIMGYRTRSSCFINAANSELNPYMTASNFPPNHDFLCPGRPVYLVDTRCQDRTSGQAMGKYTVSGKEYINTSIPFIVYGTGSMNNPVQEDGFNKYSTLYVFNQSVNLNLKNYGFITKSEMTGFGSFAELAYNADQTQILILSYPFKVYPTFSFPNISSA